MCRLFGMHAGDTAIGATFWLIDAPDSLSAQSHRNPDGTGIGVFGASGHPMIDKQPIAAWQDPEFESGAHDLQGTTFVAHVRYASTGGHTVANTHPFLQDDRIFAHNGVVAGLDELDARLTTLGAAELVQGETDSERVFALITAETRRHDGDVSAGVTAAIGWISENLPVYSLNFVLATATELWALRYPAANELYVLDRPAGGTDAAAPLDARTDRIHAQSQELAQQRSVVVASEPMDADPGWRLLESGELLHVRADLSIDSSSPIPHEPRRLLELNAHSAASQQS